MQMGYKKLRSNYVCKLRQNHVTKTTLELPLHKNEEILNGNFIFFAVYVWKLC